MTLNCERCSGEAIVFDGGRMNPGPPHATTVTYNVLYF